MPAFRDLTGKRFGELRVIERVENHPHYHTMWLCECSCGTRKAIPMVTLCHSNTVSCGCVRKRKSKERSLENAHQWKGGIKIDEKGYVFEYVGKGERVAQHRRIYAEYLGRELLPHENIHHKNGNRSDNRIENLELWSTKQPYGQRIDDKLQYAREIISQYEVNERYPAS